MFVEDGFGGSKAGFAPGQLGKQIKHLSPPTTGKSQNSFLQIDGLP